MFMSMESCQTQIYIHINSQLTNDDSNEEVLETLSNLFSAAKRLFSNHLGLRIYRMRSPLTRSDRFHVDLLTTSIYTLPYPEHPMS